MSQLRKWWARTQHVTIQLLAQHRRKISKTIRLRILKSLCFEGGIESVQAYICTVSILNALRTLFFNRKKRQNFKISIFGNFSVDAVQRVYGKFANVKFTRISKCLHFGFREGKEVIIDIKGKEQQRNVTNLIRRDTSAGIELAFKRPPEYLFLFRNQFSCKLCCFLLILSSESSTALPKFVGTVAAFIPSYHYILIFNFPQHPPSKVI